MDTRTAKKENAEPTSVFARVEGMVDKRGHASYRGCHASANQLAKDLAIRSAKASELKAKNKTGKKPLIKERASKFSGIINQTAKLKKFRKKVMADTALAAGVSGPPRLIISHLEARNFLAREIRKR